MSNVNFEGRIEKQRGKKHCQQQITPPKKRGLCGANDTVEKDFNCKETLCIHQRVHCKHQKAFSI